jgi:fumarate reductase (CoM/CoB) subunit A
VTGTIIAQSYLAGLCATFIKVDYSGKSINSYDIMITVNTDVLVLGAGAAGIRAALAACKEGAQVTIVSKGQVAGSGSTFSNISRGWGIQALVQKECSNEDLETFYDEIICVGLGECDSKLAQILVEESGSRVEDLISYGIRFRKDSDGNYLRVKGCFSDYRRAFIAHDLSNIQKTFLSLTRNIPANIVSGCVLDLMVAEGACRGAWVLSKDRDIIRINARSTILATGGGGGVYQDHLVSDEDVGDGYALAHRAGAALKNMEFIQFMLGLRHNGARSILPVSDLYKSGMIQMRDGGDLLETYIPDIHCRSNAIDARLKHYPFSCRDLSCLVDLAVARVREDGKRIYWGQSPKVETQPEVMHFAHAFNGGLEINDKGESSVPGLYAAGEVASGPHGADRMGGCMMTATQVFGERSGRFAAIYARGLGKTTSPEIDNDIGFAKARILKRENNRALLTEIKNEIKKAMSKYVSILKWEKGLKKCKEIIHDYENQLNEIKLTDSPDLVQYFKVKNMILTCKLIIEQAITRKESKGSHYLEDISLN